MLSGSIRSYLAGVETFKSVSQPCPSITYRTSACAQQVTGVWAEPDANCGTNLESANVDGL